MSQDGGLGSECLWGKVSPGPYINLREFVNYRHPDPRHGEPRACSTQLDAFLDDLVESSKSGAKLREVHLEAPLSKISHIWPENGYPF